MEGESQRDSLRALPRIAELLPPLRDSCAACPERAIAFSGGHENRTLVPPHELDSKTYHDEPRAEALVQLLVSGGRGKICLRQKEEEKKNGHTVSFFSSFFAPPPPKSGMQK